MATARPPGGQTAGGPQARIGIDLSLFREAVNVARESGRATSREISQAFRTVQNEQRIALEQARQTTAVLRAQQTQISASTRAESSVRISTARQEAQAQQQAARVAAATRIEEERRITAQVRSELRIREAEQRAALRASQTGGVGGFGRGVAGAALGAIGGPVGAIAGAAAGGAVPAAIGLAVVEGGRQAVAASQVASAYNRQRVAALQLAGSQTRLNELMAAYTRAAGGAVDRATALSNVTRLQAVGFADNAEEVDRFTRAVRGSSIAMGRLQEEISQEVQLAISNQSLRRLDQIGLGITEVNNRIAELRAGNAGMTREVAFQEAVLGLLIEKYGALADSVEGQATGTERLTAAWADMRLELGQDVRINVNQATNALADLLNWIRDVRSEMRQWGQELEDERILEVRAIARGRGLPPPESTLTSREQAFIADMGARTRARRASRDTGFAPSLDDEQVAALRRREEGFAEIERSSTRARLEERTSFERQRASIISNYERSILREAEDFGRQRALAERRHQQAILDVARDSARQRAKWEEESARILNEARAERDERVAELRADSAERVAEIEEQFARDQEKRARDHRERLRDAVANLDAVAVREEQRRFREENQEAKEAHDEQVADARESLQEAIDDQNKALAKQEQQQRESLQRRIQEQAENDRLRIEEMKAAFEAQKAQEDIERGIRLERQAEDHDAQLGELDRQHGERIQQIKDQAQEERDQFTEESNAFLEEVGIHNQAWLDEQERLNAGVIQRHQELLDFQRRSLLMPGHPSLADPYADRALPSGAILPPAPTSTSSVTNSRASTVNIQPGAITIVPPPNANFSLDERFAAYIHSVLADFFEGYPQ